VPAIQWPPLPTAWTSLILPPVPVVAPLNGATPVGKLCVSAVKMRCDLLTTSLKLLASFESLGRRCFTLKPSMALLLSLNLMTLFGLVKFCVFMIMSINDSGCSLPFITIRPLKNQCLLCSLFDWARSKHSTLVGLRFNLFLKRSV